MAVNENLFLIDPKTIAQEAGNSLVPLVQKWPQLPLGTLSVSSAEISQLPVLLSPDKYFDSNTGIGRVHIAATEDLLTGLIAAGQLFGEERFRQLIGLLNESRVYGMSLGHGFGGRLNAMYDSWHSMAAWRNLHGIKRLADLLPDELISAIIPHLFAVSADVLSGETSLNPRNPRRHQAVELYQRLREEGRIMTMDNIVHAQPPEGGVYHLMSDGGILIAPQLPFLGAYHSEPLALPPGVSTLSSIIRL